MVHKTLLAAFIHKAVCLRPSLIAGLDCGLDRWTGLWTGSVDWIVDWIGGLDCWTGLLDPTKLPVKAMMHV